MNNRISYVSIFFSTVYNKVYYLSSSLTIALLMEFITTVNINISNTIMYWIAFIIYTIAMISVYIVSKKYREKHNSLEIKQLSGKYIALRVSIMIIYTMIETILISMIHILVILKIIIQ